MKKLWWFILVASMLSSVYALPVEPIDPRPIIKLYPQTVLTPTAPSTNDSVSFWLILGEENNTCYPRYTSSYTIEKSGSLNIIRVFYKQSLVRLGVVCLVTPTYYQYGPTFAFGKLAAGSYAIVDTSAAQGALSTDTLKKFTVASTVATYSLAGKVIDAASSAGIAGAHLYLKKRNIIILDPILKKQRVLEPVMPLYTTIDSTTSATGGTYAFPAKYATGSYLLSTTANNYIPKDTGVSLSANTDLTVKLAKMTLYCKIKGSVVEYCPESQDSCTPGVIESCLVSIGFPVIEPLLIEPVLSKARIIDPILPPIRTRAYSVFTDKNGNFTIDSIPGSDVPQRVIVSASKDGFQTVSFDTVITSGTISFDFAILKQSVKIIYAHPQSIRAPQMSWYSRNGRLTFQLPDANRVTVEMCDLDGKSIGMVFNGLLGEGTHTITIDKIKNARRSTILKVNAGTTTEVHKIVLF